MGHVTITTPLLGTFVVSGLGLDMIKLCAPKLKSLRSPITKI